MKSRSLTYPVVIAILAIWLGLTLFIDFVAVPLLFRNLGDFFRAGDLGIMVFTQFNSYELVMGGVLLGLLGIVQNPPPFKRSLSLVLVIILCGITLYYSFYLTPKIQELTTLWKTADAQGVAGLAGITDLQQEHQFFHRLYVGIDTLKILLLSFLLGFFIYKGRLA